MGKHRAHPGLIPAGTEKLGGGSIVPPPQLVSRDDIAKRLCGPDVFIDLDAGIHTAILKIRQVLGDSRESRQFVETVLGVGPFETARSEGRAMSPVRAIALAREQALLPC